MTVGSYDPMKGERMSGAWVAIRGHLEDRAGQWVTRDELVEVGLAASDLQKSTIQNMLSGMSAPDGLLERRDSVKTRKYRLVHKLPGTAEEDKQGP